MILYRDICRILGTFLFGLAAAMIVPLFLAIYYQYLIDPSLHPQPHSSSAFLFSVLICLALAYLAKRTGRQASSRLYRREAIAAVALIWIITPAIAAMPFILSETLTNPLQAYFETTSGITTTGSTVMEPKHYDSITGKEIPIHQVICGDVDTTYEFYGTIPPVIDSKTGLVLFEGIEAVSKAILFWRSFLQWLGGVGVIVLFVAVLPALGVGGKFLFQSEIAGPIKEMSTPRIKEAASNTCKMYAALTILQIILLFLVNSEISWLDAVTTTFGTISTGGLSIRNANITAYHSAPTEWVIMLFMLLGSLNFSLYYAFIRGKFYRLNDPELWIYLGIILSASTFTIWNLIGTPNRLLSGELEGVYSSSEAIRQGFFHIISAISTTGFFTVDYDQWPYAIQSLILMIMFIGGMSGSTSGGIKVIRYYIIFRICLNKIKSLYRPEAIHQFRVGGREVEMETAVMVLCFFVIVISLVAIGTFFLILDGVDPETSLSTIASSITNGGMGFRMSGPKSSFAFLSNFGVILSSIWMLLGRLEFFTLLVLFIPGFWKQKQ